jgi:hypothetical protein
MTPDLDTLKTLRGLVGTVCTSGAVMPEFASAREEMRAWNISNGFTSVEYVTENAVLVEHGRDALAAHALAEKYDFMLQVDADAIFPPDALARILHTAFIRVPDADVVGAYAQLKNEPFLPTIDTGTGTWEPIFPGEGVLPVIRTGAHFLLVKTPILARFGPPWFRTRRSVRPIDALREIDNFSRLKNRGRNVLAGEAWDTLVAAAQKDSGGVESAVGEDSGFCDAAMAAGARIYVDTDLVTGHVAKRLITPEMLADSLKKRDAMRAAAVGVVG